MKSNYFFKQFEKKLRFGFIPKSGRNFLGVICLHHRGGGSKKKSYFVDFFRRVNSFGFVVKLLKVPFYTSFLGLVIFKNGLCSYLLLSDQVNVGTRIYCGTYLDKTKLSDVLVPGVSLPLHYMDLFSNVSNVELKPYHGGVLARSAGSGLIITSKFDDKVLLKSKSKWNFLISNNNIASLGVSSNTLYKFLRLEKAGKVRALGIRPTVRGVAMNPCDHPHGGGEGKKSPPAAARSPWGWLTKNMPSKIKKRQLLFKKNLKVIR